MTVDPPDPADGPGTPVDRDEAGPRLPRLAILGRPNVGKSTLFNRLVGRRAALVDDRPGVTRDRREGAGSLYGDAFTVIDTAGLEDAEKGSLSARMAAQSLAALTDADIALFVVDARAGLTEDDRHFARLLRRSARVPVVLVANKAEGAAAGAGLLEAFELGLGDPVAVSAEHGQGLADLHEALRPHLAALADSSLDVAPDAPKRPIRIAFVGRPNAGKSTLVNRLIGEDRLLTGPEAGITRDSIRVPFTWKGRPMELIDTAGLRKRAKVEEKLEKLSAADTRGAVGLADVVVLLVDATRGLEAQELRIADFALSEGRALVVAINKWDVAEDRSRLFNGVKLALEEGLGQVRGLPLLAVSGATGKGLSELIDAAIVQHDRWNRRVPTSGLNRWFEAALARNPPPAPGGRRIKLRYVTRPTRGRPPSWSSAAGSTSCRKAMPAISPTRCAPSSISRACPSGCTCARPKAPMDRLDALTGCGAPDALALADTQERLSYAALDALVERLAGAIAAATGAGDRVAVWLPKSCRAAALVLAVSRAGRVAVPVNPALRPRQVAHVLNDSGAALVISHRARAAGLGALPGLTLWTLEADWEAMLAAGDTAPGGARGGAAPGETAPGGDTLAALLYTSGSTGLPRGVMVTHANLLTGARSVASYLGTGRNDRVLAVLPLSFDFGLSQLTTALFAGASAILLDYLAPRDVLLAVERERATQLAAVPPLWMQLAALDWPDTARASLATLSNSGGRLPVPTVRALRQRFPAARLHLMYGLTEAFRSTTLPPELVDEHPDSIGRAIPDAEVLVVREDGTLTADGEPGELVHAGPLVAKGYWQDPERTALRFRPAPPASRLGGVAVWSGDTVVRDAAGLLRFVGRADEMIKVSGHRVSPTEVEELALASGAVSGAVAIGVPNAALGALILLVAVPAEGLDAASAEARLFAFLRREAPAYLLPSRLVWNEALPLSPNGKIDRARLRQEHGQG
jgi:GTP-binding protein